MKAPKAYDMRRMLNIAIIISSDTTRLLMCFVDDLCRANKECSYLSNVVPAANEVRCLLAS